MRNCIITGATSGIGKATAAAFARAGDRAFVAGRDADKVETTVRELSSFGKVEGLVFDVADQKATETAFAKVGTVHVVVSSAGVCLQARLDEPESDDVWRTTIDANLNGAYYTLKAGASRIVDGGSMVTISSGLGKNARAAYEAYCASKHGLLGLTKCVALELAPRRVRVNAICPGWVDTPMSRGDVVVSARREGISPETLRTQAIAGIPLGRMVEPEEVAALALFLCSEQALSITGEAYNISGGEFSN